MLALGISFAHVYSSPALRCIQTAFHILQGSKTFPIYFFRLEPNPLLINILPILPPIQETTS